VKSLLTLLKTLFSTDLRNRKCLCSTSLHILVRCCSRLTETGCYLLV
jgi:hypothetical protein